jgi:hypothetical protein
MEARVRSNSEGEVVAVVTLQDQEAVGTQSGSAAYEKMVEGSVRSSLEAVSRQILGGDENRSVEDAVPAKEEID